MDITHDSPASTNDHGPVAQDPHAAATDVQDVADRVYRLLLADVRLDVARGGAGVREN
jgi:hypothetical protein